ncbi:hypothetical protein DPEC_G00124350 [Dallia pectoralis]|uniref:Uncharacterized protein n=1 Tax=Dallia pectoralis TaxID=75939 RepID=A0ACC2GQZ2_DALPE|nr:hypothetical protein DPEC_G00124350 [Dallia pectoralis]
MAVPVLKSDTPVDDDAGWFPHRHNKDGFPSTVSKELLAETRRKRIVGGVGRSIIFQTPGRRNNQAQCINVITRKAVEHYEKGEKALKESQFSNAVTCFAKAINLQPKQTQLYVSQAEAYLQMCDFQSAADGYRHACLLEPQSSAFHTRMAFIYYLQGQCLYDKQMFLDALESFTKAAELKPSNRPYKMRSLACLTAMGRYTDCVRLVSNWLETDSQTADLFTLRARLHKQLNQVTMCYHDLRSALALNPNCPVANALLGQLQDASARARQQAVCWATAGRIPDALSKINTALEHCPETGRHYLFRGILYRRLKNFTDAIDDLVLAVELSEAGGQGVEPQEDQREVQEEAQAQLVLTYNDFAVRCFSRSFYAEAVTLLNKAIQEQKEESGLYINRGDCFFKQEEWEFALADYQQAEEISPNDSVIWIRLAVMHNTLGTQCYQDHRYQEAADKFSEAIRYNPGVSRYYENRAKAHSRVANVERAMQDAITSLILDPTNDQVAPLLLSLFPGYSVSDLLSSRMARTVKTQLMDSIQTRRQSASSMPRMHHGLNKINLSSDKDSRSDGESSEGTEPLKTRDQDGTQML